MRIHEALQYLPQKNLDPLTVIECQALNCTRNVQLAKAFAFPAAIEHQMTIAFFCSEGCYLDAVPPCACPQA